MNCQKSLFFIVLLLPLTIVLGCGPRLNLGSVSGTITYKGQPVEGATVTFLPTSPDGVLAVSTTDAAGKYTLAAPVQLKGRRVAAGAFAGKYTVTVRKVETILSETDRLFQEGKISFDELMARGGGGGGKSKELLPVKYRNAKSTNLEAEVKAKTDNVFDFELVD